MYTFLFYGATVQSAHLRASFDYWPAANKPPIRMINKPLPFLLEAMRQSGIFNADLWKLRKSAFYVPERFGIKLENGSLAYFDPRTDRMIMRVAFPPDGN